MKLIKKIWDQSLVLRDIMVLVPIVVVCYFAFNYIPQNPYGIMLLLFMAAALYIVGRILNWLLDGILGGE